MCTQLNVFLILSALNVVWKWRLFWSTMTEDTLPNMIHLAFCSISFSFFDFLMGQKAPARNVCETSEYTTFLYIPLRLPERFVYREIRDETVTFLNFQTLKLQNVQLFQLFNFQTLILSSKTETFKISNKIEISNRANTRAR